MKEIKLTKPNEPQKISFDLENPYVKILKAKIEYNHKNNPFCFLIVKATLKSKEENKGNTTLFQDHSPHEISIEKEITQLDGIDSIQVHFEIDKDLSGIKEITLFYENSRYLANKNSDNDFGSHLKDTKNAKILFSAPFGEGKTTFLNYFFDLEKIKKEYEVFKVFPVNYSVASNEDIFRYIKTDILFQLLGRIDLEFDEFKPSLSLTVQQFVIAHPEKLIPNFIKLLMSLDLKSLPFVSVITKLEKLANDFIEHHNNAEIDDKEKATNYIKRAYETEGSIYEDNFYTQLIRQLLEQIKIKNRKKTVLIIDDLDRMDPEHIFRILNVISAHYDTYQSTEDQSQNKFGFDKIIIVCDIKNIQNIFEHRYGNKTDFKGYINKFYSTQTFYFSNKIASHSYLKDILEQFDKNDIHYSNSFYLLSCLIEGGVITFRDLMKIKNYLTPVEFEKIQLKLSKTAQKDKILEVGFFAPIISILLDNFSYPNLITSIKKIKDKKVTHGNLNIRYMIGLLITPIATYNNDKNQTASVNYGDKTLKVESNSILHADSIKIKIGEDFQNFEPTIDDFYDLLIENVHTINRSA